MGRACAQKEREAPIVPDYNRHVSVVLTYVLRVKERRWGADCNQVVRVCGAAILPVSPGSPSPPVFSELSVSESEPLSLHLSSLFGLLRCGTMTSTRTLCRLWATAAAVEGLLAHVRPRLPPAAHVLFLRQVASVLVSLAGSERDQEAETGTKTERQSVWGDGVRPMFHVFRLLRSRVSGNERGEFDLAHYFDLADLSCR